MTSINILEGLLIPDLALIVDNYVPGILIDLFPEAATTGVVLETHYNVVRRRQEFHFWFGLFRHQQHCNGTRACLDGAWKLDFDSLKGLTLPLVPLFEINDFGMCYIVNKTKIPIKMTPIVK